MVLHKSLQQPPIYLKTEATWMWHSLNTYEMGDEICCYFCGYDEPDHFIGNHAQTFEIMRPNATVESTPATSPGSVRLVRINLRTRKIYQEHLTQDPDRTYEFPVINEQFSAQQNNYGYLASGKIMGAFHHEISRVNIHTGRIETFDFGKDQYCGEPIFVPKPGFAYQPDSSTEPGWIMTLVFDQQSDKSYVAILNTAAIADGPIAKVHLQHHSPMSFHGTWRAEQ